jgi:DNA mismatch repair protein MutS
MSVVTELTPMLRHYMELKATQPDALLFYRMGDFFELFFDDAREAAGLLDLTLTARQKGTDSEAPMCGVPHHAIEGYVGKLLRMGRKVAICDQVEDPATAKGLVRREITRILSPGTLAETSLLESREESLLAALVFSGGAAAAAFLDVSTGRFVGRRFRDAAEALAELELTRPRELLCDEDAAPEEVVAWLRREIPCRTPLAPRRLSPRAAAEKLRRQFGVATLRGYGLEEEEPVVVAAAAALSYAQENQLSGLAHIRDFELAELADRLVVDATTFANLEVFRAQREGGEATLVGLLDRTATAAGGRLLREWLRRPLADPAAIGLRLDGVAALVAAPLARSRLRQRLARIPDFERLATRAVIGTLTPREAGALREGLAEAPAAFAEVSGLAAAVLTEAAATYPEAALAALLARTLAESPSASLQDGGVIAEGIDPALDEARSLARNGKQHILDLEDRERRRTGIGSLKIRYNRVFGYSIEISRANAARVPADYVRRQTLVNAERYVTAEVSELEQKILGAEQSQLALEKRLFEELRAAIAARAEPLARIGRALARVDALAGWAEVAAEGAWCRPEVVPSGGGISIQEGRHPIVARALGDDFVPNDCELDPGGARIVLLTGPNMGGKSTYLRQVALIVLLAQAGCFVPAASARISAVDRIFSRVGASDDLARGESTFMVEMIETANILRFATERSLVILDEVGRGTATFDGLSLAWAIVEHLHERRRALTLFATHYHELTELAELLPGVVNRTMAVREWEDRIVFLRRVIPGSADKSYGLHVARLAGLPEEVVARAERVLARLEAQEFDPSGRPRLAAGERYERERAAQLALFRPPEEIVATLLRELDVDRLTPLAALNLIASLKARLGETPGEP